MNNLIAEQLNKCSPGTIPSWDSTTTSLFIPKVSSEYIAPTVSFGTTLMEGRKYKISVENYIINPPPGFDLHINWNNNIPPKDKVMVIEVLQLNGKMVKVTSTSWEGWLPMKSITILEELQDGN